MTAKQASVPAKRKEKSSPPFVSRSGELGWAMCPDMSWLFGVGRDPVLDAIRPHGVGIVIGKLIDSPRFYEDDDVHRCPVVGIVDIHRGERNALMNIESVLEPVDVEMRDSIIDRGDFRIFDI